MIKIRFKSEFAISSKSISYKVALEKVLNWISKGR